MEPVFWDLGALLDFAVKVSSGPLPQRIHTRIGHKIIETRNPESLIENVCESFQLVAGIVPQNVIIKYRV